MQIHRSSLIGGAALALAIAPLTAQVQTTREVVQIGGGVATQDIRIATEAAVSGLANSRLPSMPLGQGVIVGQTVDAGSKQPIGGTIVTLALPGAQSVRALADSEGRFAFRDLPKGRFTLTASKAGYVEGAHGRLRPSGPSQALELADGDKDATLSIPLWRYAAITGTVLDESGEPMIATSVRAMKRTTVAGLPKLTMASTDMTDDRGVFRITMLEPGDYVIAVPMTQSSGEFEGMWQASGDFIAEVGARGDATFISLPDRAGNAGTAPDGRALAYQTQFYPATTASARATVLTVGSGEERAGIDFQLKGIRTQKIAGRVTGPDGPAQHTQMSLVPSDSDGLVSPIEAATTMSDGTGAFSFPAVPPGQYTLKVVRPPAMNFRGVPEEVTVTTSGGGGTMVVSRAITATMAGPGQVPPLPSDPTLWAEVPVTVANADLADVMVALRPGARVRGAVQFNGTAEKPTPDKLQAISVSLEVADGRPLTQMPFLRGRVENTGQFSTVTVPSGRYFLRVGGVPQGWSFRGAMLGGRDLADTPLEIEGTDIGGVTLVFTDRLSEISGSVTGANGSADGTATVLVFPTDRDGWTHYGTSPRRLRNARVDKTGAFSVGNLPAGEYYVAAVREASATDWQNVKFLEALAPEARRVQLGEGQKSSQSLRVVR
jgi:hypothetical protein